MGGGRENRGAGVGRSTPSAVTKVFRSRGCARPATTPNPSMVCKRMIVAELPVSTRPSKERRYRVADPYLRFWLCFVRPHLPETERLRGDLAVVGAFWTWSNNMD